MIEVEGLQKQFADVVVLDEINMKLESGKRYFAP